MKHKFHFLLSRFICYTVTILGTTSMLLGPCHGPLYQPSVPAELKND